MSSPVHDALKTQIVELTLKSNLLVKEIKDLRKEHLDTRALVTNIYNLATF